MRTLIVSLSLLGGCIMVAPGEGGPRSRVYRSQETDWSMSERGAPASEAAVAAERTVIIRDYSPTFYYSSFSWGSPWCWGYPYGWGYGYSPGLRWGSWGGGASVMFRTR